MASFRRLQPHLRLTSTGSRQLASTTVPSRPPPILIGAPDVISNIRPVIYDGVWFKAISTAQDPSPSSSSLPVTTLVHPDKDTEHPYALEEFASTKGHESDRFFEEKESWEMRYRLQKQSFDAFNHAFWTDTNSRMNTYKNFVATSTTASPEYTEASPEKREMMMDGRLAAFYFAWLEAERPRQRAYMREFYRRTFSMIWFEFRLKLQTMRWAVRSVMSKNLV